VSLLTRLTPSQEPDRLAKPRQTRALPDLNDPDGSEQRPVDDDHMTEAKMTKRDSVAIVERFWAEVWQRPQNPHAIDTLVTEDFVITSGGHDIVSRQAFKAWVIEFQSKVLDMDFEIIESFQNHDGSRVASRWRLTGRNNGIMGTEPNGAPIDMVGTAVWEVGDDGLLRHNWVDRNAWEVHGAITSTTKKRIF
jgi:SnoaL-like domain